MLFIHTIQPYQKAYGMPSQQSLKPVGQLVLLICDANFSEHFPKKVKTWKNIFENYVACKLQQMLHMMGELIQIGISQILYWCHYRNRGLHLSQLLQLFALCKAHVNFESKIKSTPQEHDFSLTSAWIHLKLKYKPMYKSVTSPYTHLFIKYSAKKSCLTG